MRFIRLKDHKPLPWKNGGGTTIELLKIPHPKDPESFLLRISKAKVEKSGPFSVFENVDRHLILICGQGMQLSFSQGPSQILNKPMQIFKFPGEESIQCDIIDGPNEDFNVMIDRRWGEANITILKVKKGHKLQISSRQKTLIYQVEPQVLIETEFESFELDIEADMTLFKITIVEKLQFNLKTIARGHTEEFFNLISRNRFYLKQWLGWLDDLQTIDQLNNYIENSLKDISEEKLYRSWIWYEGKIAGIIHLAEVDWVRRKAMVGYWVGQEYARLGLATKATAQMVDFAFKEWEMQEIEIRCASGNIPSQKVAQKLGFTRTAVLHESEWLYDHHVDHIVFTKYKKDWPLT